MLFLRTDTAMSPVAAGSTEVKKSISRRFQRETGEPEQPLPALPEVFQVLNIYDVLFRKQLFMPCQVSIRNRVKPYHVKPDPFIVSEGKKGGTGPPFLLL